jgi:hypothetical protein
MIHSIQDKQRNILKEVHDHPTAAHPGRDKTLHKLKEQGIEWTGMKHWVADYVKGYAVCQQSKILMHRTKIPLYHIPTPMHAKPFQQVAMDLITGLPPQAGKDAILTNVDHRCSRVAIFLPCTATITGLDIVQLYFEHIF